MSSVLSLKPKPSIEVGANYKSVGEKVTEESDTQEIDFFDTLHGQSQDGYPCWRVRGVTDDILDGSLWDPLSQTLLTISDRRPDDIIRKDSDRSIFPHAVIQIRCFREDLSVYEITFNNPDEESFFLSRKGKDNRLRAAEAYLKREMLSEGLIFGDLSDLYSELLLADMVVPLYE